MIEESMAERKAFDLLQRVSCVQVTTVDFDGFPVTKAFLPPLETEGMETLWFSTNTSSRKVSRIALNPRACVYAFDAVTFEGLSLIGTMKSFEDAELKSRFWREGFELYYPRGLDDPDYTVLRFVGSRAFFYDDLQETSWEIN